MTARTTRCRECGEKHQAKALRGATAAQAERSHKIIEGDLLCADCRADLTPIRWQASGVSASLAYALGLGGAL